MYCVLNYHQTTLRSSSDISNKFMELWFTFLIFWNDKAVGQSVRYPQDHSQPEKGMAMPLALPPCPPASPSPPLSLPLSSKGGEQQMTGIPQGLAECIPAISCSSPHWAEGGCWLGSKPQQAHIWSQPSATPPTYWGEEEEGSCWLGSKPQQACVHPSHQPPSPPPTWWQRTRVAASWDAQAGHGLLPIHQPGRWFKM